MDTDPISEPREGQDLVDGAPALIDVLEKDAKRAALCSVGVAVVALPVMVLNTPERKLQWLIILAAGPLAGMLIWFLFLCVVVLFMRIAGVEGLVEQDHKLVLFPAWQNARSRRGDRFSSFPTSLRHIVSLMSWWTICWLIACGISWLVR